MRERMSKTLETKIMNKTILVTGSSGFIGTNLLEMLHEKKIPSISVSRTQPRIQSPWLQKDFSELTREDVAEASYVVHCAAVSSPARARGNEQETENANVKKLRVFLEMLSDDKKLLKVIIFSSIIVYHGNGMFQENSPLDYEPKDI